MSERSFRSTGDLSADLHQARVNSRQSLNLEERDIAKQHMSTVKVKAYSIQDHIQKIDKDMANNKINIEKLRQQIMDLEAYQDSLQMKKDELSVEYDSLGEKFNNALQVYGGKTPVVNLDNSSPISSRAASSVGEDDFPAMEAGMNFSKSSKCSYMGPDRGTLDISDIMSQTNKSRKSKQSAASAQRDDDTHSVRSTTSSAAFSRGGDAWAFIS